MIFDWRDWEQTWIDYALDTRNKELFELLTSENSMYHIILRIEKVDDLFVELEQEAYSYAVRN